MQTCIKHHFYQSICKISKASQSDVRKHANLLISWQLFLKSVSYCFVRCILFSVLCCDAAFISLLNAKGNGTTNPRFGTSLIKVLYPSKQQIPLSPTNLQRQVLCLGKSFEWDDQNPQVLHFPSVSSDIVLIVLVIISNFSFILTSRSCCVLRHSTALKTICCSLKISLFICVRWFLVKW